jgi:hypothetical protein
MHENALVKHVRFAGWVGRVARCPRGERAGAFYRNDTVCFYVVWTAGAGANADLHLCNACGHHHYGRGPLDCPPNLPEHGWYPAADLVRVTR